MHSCLDVEKLNISSMSAHMAGARTPSCEGVSSATDQDVNRRLGSSVAGTYLMGWVTCWLMIITRSTSKAPLKAVPLPTDPLTHTLSTPTPCRRWTACQAGESVFV